MEMVLSILQFVKKNHSPVVEIGDPKELDKKIWAEYV